VAGITTVSELTPLGRWTMHESRPRPLRHIVEAVWEVHGTVANTRARHFPSGAVDLLVNLGAPQRLIGEAGEDRFEQGQAWLAGLQVRPLVVESEHHVHIFGIRLRAAGASIVLGAPMGIAAERVLHLEDLTRPAAARLLAAIHKAGTFSDRLAAACCWIERQCGSLDGRPDYLDWLARRIEASNGTAPIGPMRREAGISGKKLTQDFTRRLGLTPKLLGRVHRFRHARLVVQRPGRALADTAAICGYFDQSHMTRDFRDLGGLTPGDYLASCYPDGNSGVITAS
jgi:AraC-like DNA-binding protein